MKIGFIGAGKMARALASGLVQSKIVGVDELTCSSRTAESGRAFTQLFPKKPEAPSLQTASGRVIFESFSEGKPRWTSDNAEIVRENDFIVLAIKPQQFPQVLPLLREASAGKLFLSLAAGITLSQLSGWLHPTARLVRAMPNTPMQIGLGASVYAGQPGTTEEDLALVEKILRSAGQAWRVQENQIDAVTALSGSGPAYVFHFIDALIRAAIPLGLDEELARALALQTVLGAAQLAAQSELTPLELATQVKSPRGTTLAGCAVLEENDALNNLMARTLAAAKARAEALSRGEA